jgi:6,7-dimethyl-8-ribityllumazine synthase
VGWIVATIVARLWLKHSLEERRAIIGESQLIAGANKTRTVRGGLSAAGLHFGIVVADFNSFITDRLLAGALDALARAGAGDEQIETIRVPGSFEIPLAAKKLAATGRVDAVICIGCVLRGETSHYDYVASETARGIQLAQLDSGVPMAFCVLTCDTLEQAIDRAGLKGGNKGFEAGLGAVEMAQLSRKLARNPARVAAEKPRMAAEKSSRNAAPRASRDRVRGARRR